MFVVEKSDVGMKLKADSRAAVRRRRNLCDPSVPSDIEEPGAGSGKMTEGCALLECHLRSGSRAQSSTLVHDQPGSCSWWCWAWTENDTELGASGGPVGLQRRSDRICQLWRSNVQQNWQPTGDGQGGRRLSHREGYWRNRRLCRRRHGPRFGWQMKWVSAELCEFGEAGSNTTGRVWWYDP